MMNIFTFVTNSKYPYLVLNTCFKIIFEITGTEIIWVMTKSYCWSYDTFFQKNICIKFIFAFKILEFCMLLRIKSSSACIFWGKFNKKMLYSQRENIQLLGDNLTPETLSSATPIIMPNQIAFETSCHDYRLVAKTFPCLTSSRRKPVDESAMEFDIR